MCCVKWKMGYDESWVRRSSGVSSTLADLQTVIEELYACQTDQYGDEHFRAFDEFKSALNEGHVRAAESDPTSPTGWKVNT